MTAPPLPPAPVSGQCPLCGKRYRNLRPVLGALFPEHTEQGYDEPCAMVDLGYAVNAECAYLRDLVDTYRLRLETLRAAMDNPLRARRPGDLRKLHWLESRIAVLSHRADRLREAVNAL